MDNSECSLRIYLNLSKAFDNVDHKILLDRMESYGIKGVAKMWFKSNLPDIQQYKIVNNSTSDQMNITTGVPQGPSLWPVLFLFYVNESA